MQNSPPERPERIVKRFGAIDAEPSLVAKTTDTSELDLARKVTSMVPGSSRGV